MKEIKNVTGRRFKLDSIAEGTLNINKSGHGLQAITWWKQGDIEKIRQYCLDDVKITKKVYDYALKNSKLKYKDAGKIISISDNPNFRAFWYGTNKIFLNALFFGKSIGGGRFGEED